MDIGNNTNYNNNNLYENENINNNEDMYSINRYDGRRYNQDNRYDMRYDMRYDRRYDRRFDNDNYYRYPYCDRNGRCDNSLWWMFWPFFFF